MTSIQDLLEKYQIKNGIENDQARIDEFVKELKEAMNGVIGKEIKPFINGKYPADGKTVTIDFKNNHKESIVFIQENGKRVLQNKQRQALNKFMGGNHEN